MKKKLFYNDKLFQEVLGELYTQSRLAMLDQYIQHGNTSLLEHCIYVAQLSYRLALFLRLPVNHRKLIRGALLHDYFLYDWHIKDSSHALHGFRHPKTAYKNARRDIGQLSAVEKDIILKHMFPLTLVPPKYIESLIVCLADKLCSLYEIFYIPSLHHFILRKIGGL